ncbi:hypothetical protein HNY73_010027 [Argiope bruennichi]|uniref:Uncharacterized protein n=1 Tax=Argiope bruennichi TaxID=94029 RepID=A0A8T0EZU9_ARGBR|nr:hypothetical protein HNY73_010027 [Argiope bruennichi]
MKPIVSTGSQYENIVVVGEAIDLAVFQTGIALMTAENKEEKDPKFFPRNKFIFSALAVTRFSGLTGTKIYAVKPVLA